MKGSAFLGNATGFHSHQAFIKILLTILHGLEGNPDTQFLKLDWKEARIFCQVAFRDCTLLSGQFLVILSSFEGRY